MALSEVVVEFVSPEQEVRFQKLMQIVLLRFLRTRG